MREQKTEDLREKISAALNVIARQEVTTTELEALGYDIYRCSDLDRDYVLDRAIEIIEDLLVEALERNA